MDQSHDIYIHQEFKELFVMKNDVYDPGKISFLKDVQGVLKFVKNLEKGLPSSRSKKSDLATEEALQAFDEFILVQESTLNKLPTDHKASPLLINIMKILHSIRKNITDAKAKQLEWDFFKEQQTKFKDKIPADHMNENKKAVVRKFKSFIKNHSDIVSEAFRYPSPNSNQLMFHCFLKSKELLEKFDLIEEFYSEFSKSFLAKKLEVFIVPMFPEKRKQCWDFAEKLL